jgi:uncharacterized lipoprotein YajG
MDQHMKRSWLKITLLGVILIAGVACAKKSYIYVDYRLPTVTDRLQGRSLFVETHDLRRNREIFNPRAKESGDEQTLKGAYELPMLFEAALKERLDALGITIAGGQSANIPLFKINLNQFRINLVGQKWIADISYEVSLTQDNQTVSREVVTGSAERLKLIGSGGAEKVIGEIFTEMINRLNIERLFQQANL